eukprot:915116_1
MTGIMEIGLQTSVKTASRFVVRFATLLTYCSLFAIFFGSSGVLCANKKNNPAKKFSIDGFLSTLNPKQTKNSDLKKRIGELTKLNKKLSDDIAQKDDSHSDVIAGKNDTIKTLKDHHAKLYNWNRAKEIKIEELSKKLTAKDEALAELRETNKDLNEEKENLTTTSNDLRAQLDNAEAVMESKVKELSKQLTRKGKIFNRMAGQTIG